MAPHRNIFRPDTCGCVVEFVFDDALPPDQQEASYQLHAMHGKCSRHNALPDQAAYQASWHDENKRKNQALGHLFDQHPKLRRTVRNPDTGQDEEQLDTAKVAWSYDEGGVLHLVVPALTPPERMAAAAAMLARFGSGKVAFD